MPSRIRIALPNFPVHLTQRGNNRQPSFFANEDWQETVVCPLLFLLF